MSSLADAQSKLENAMAALESALDGAALSAPPPNAPDSAHAAQILDEMTRIDQKIEQAMALIAAGSAQDDAAPANKASGHVGAGG